MFQRQNMFLYKYCECNYILLVHVLYKYITIYVTVKIVVEHFFFFFKQRNIIILELFYL